MHAEQTHEVAPRPRKIGYLVNQYPTVSQTFIRREIHAVEQAGGLHVSRYGLRPSGMDGSVHEADLQEAQKTHVVPLRATALAASILRTAVRTPTRLLGALRLSISIGWNSDRGLLRHIVYLGQACALLEAMRRDHIEHLHAHFGTKAAAVAMICRALGGPPYSVTIHGPLEFELARMLSLSQKVARSKFVAAISDFCRSQIWRNSDSAHWAKVHIVRCGVDSAFLDENPRPIPQAPRIAFVGRLSDHKAPQLLLDAAALLVREGVHVEVVFAGDGELRCELEAAVVRLGLERQVRFLGYANETMVRECIRDARALVLPSFAEGLPVVIMEAFALGRPVLSTYVAGIPELVEPGRSGWLVPPGSTEALARALREIVEAPVEMLEAMGRKGRERVLEKHDAARNGRALADLLRRSLS